MDNLTPFDEENWDEDETPPIVKKCVICGKEIKEHQPLNPIKNTHYFCWINLPYF